jgi:HPt (histidine-containing phosphotransfer) domain-containing protein
MDQNTPTPQDPIFSELVKQDASFADIVTEFVEGLSDRLAVFEETLNESDFEMLRVSAHQLTGGGDAHGYPALAEQAAKLELHAKAQAMQECLDALEELRRTVERVAVKP